MPENLIPAPDAEHKMWYLRQKATIKVFEDFERSLQTLDLFPPKIVNELENSDQEQLKKLLADHYRDKLNITDIDLAVAQAEFVLKEAHQLKSEIEQIVVSEGLYFEEALLKIASDKVDQMEDAFVVQMMIGENSSHPC